MIRRTKLWLTGSLLFAAVNAGGAVFAVALGEIMHAVGHVGLVFLGLYVAARIARRAEAQKLPGVPLFDDRLDRIQQSLDAIAVEVERIGEGQRFVVKLRQELAENGK